VRSPSNMLRAQIKPLLRKAVEAIAFGVCSIPIWSFFGR